MKKITAFLSFVVLLTLLSGSNTFAMSLNFTESLSLNLLGNLSSPPYPASNPIPANNSIDVELNITLAWIGGDPDGDPVSYNIFFGTNSNPPNVEVVYRSNTYNPGFLEYNTQYYWRIDTYADGGGATTGPLWTFTTKDDTPPYMPSNPTPSDHSTNMNRTLTHTSLVWWRSRWRPSNL